MPLKPGFLPRLPPWKWDVTAVAVAQSGSTQLFPGTAVGGFAAKANWARTPASGHRQDMPVLHYKGGPGTSFTDAFNANAPAVSDGYDWGGPGKRLVVPRSVVFQTLSSGADAAMGWSPDLVKQKRLWLFDDQYPDNPILAGIPYSGLSGFASTPATEAQVAFDNALPQVNPAQWVGGDCLRFVTHTGRYGQHDIGTLPDDYFPAVLNAGSIANDAAQLALALPRFRRFRTVYYWHTQMGLHGEPGDNPIKDAIVAAMLATGHDLVYVDDPDGLGMTKGIFDAQVSDFWPND